VVDEKLMLKAWTPLSAAVKEPAMPFSHLPPLLTSSFTCLAS
jgi:hypothetical protein